MFIKSANIFQPLPASCLDLLTAGTEFFSLRARDDMVIPSQEGAQQKLGASG